MVEACLGSLQERPLGLPEKGDAKCHATHSCFFGRAQNQLPVGGARTG